MRYMDSETEARLESLVILLDKTNENIQKLAEQLLIVATQTKSLTDRMDNVEEICQWTKTN